MSTAEKSEKNFRSWKSRGLKLHRSVLLKEAVEFLRVRAGKKYIDATAGTGGHAAAILEAGGRVLGIDADPEAVEFVRQCSATDLEVVQGNFKNIGEIACGKGFGKVAGVLFDLGMSSFQLEHSGRGFSFQKDEPLDMRMDPSLSVTAADLVNGLGRKELYELFKNFGEEVRARSIAHAVVERRRVRRIKTSRELAVLVERLSPLRRARGAKLHPATKVFQALRIATNGELENLQTALPQALGLLEPRGRLVVISFHSLEDRLVKRFFRECATKSGWGEGQASVRILTKKPVRPSAAEVSKNPRSRSAKLRALEVRN